MAGNSGVKSVTSTHAATRCNTLRCTATHSYPLLITATPCNTLLHTVTQIRSEIHKQSGYTGVYLSDKVPASESTHTATHCNTLRRTATYYSTCTKCDNGVELSDKSTTHTLQHTATHIQSAMPECKKPLKYTHTAKYYNTLPHTATHIQSTIPGCNSSMTRQPPSEETWELSHAHPSCHRPPAQLKYKKYVFK